MPRTYIQYKRIHILEYNSRARFFFVFHSTLAHSLRALPFSCNSDVDYFQFFHLFPFFYLQVFPLYFFKFGPLQAFGASVGSLLLQRILMHRQNEAGYIISLFGCFTKTFIIRFELMKMHSEPVIFARNALL